MTFKHLILLTTMLLATSQAALAEEITACDIEAAHPADPSHVGIGKETQNVDTFAGIAACRLAIKASPETARFHYQLGRSLYYQGEVTEAMVHIEHAVDLNYTQAEFIKGLLNKGQDICLAEKMFKIAADKGLKSARISYLDDFVNQRYEDCKISNSHDEIAAYLAGASTQVNGYYENMLLTNIKTAFNSANGE